MLSILSFSPIYPYANKKTVIKYQTDGELKVKI